MLVLGFETQTYLAWGWLLVHALAVLDAEADLVAGGDHAGIGVKQRVAGEMLKMPVLMAQGPDEERIVAGSPMFRSPVPMFRVSVVKLSRVRVPTGSQPSTTSQSVAAKVRWMVVGLAEGPQMMRSGRGTGGLVPVQVDQP